jgi:hypothetical protein
MPGEKYKSGRVPAHLVNDFPQSDKLAKTFSHANSPARNKLTNWVRITMNCFSSFPSLDGSPDAGMYP